MTKTWKNVSRTRLGGEFWARYVIAHKTYCSVYTYPHALSCTGQIAQLGGNKDVNTLAEYVNWKALFIYKQYKIGQNARIPKRQLEQFQDIIHTQAQSGTERANRSNSLYSVCLATCSVIMLGMATRRIQRSTANTTLQKPTKQITIITAWKFSRTRRFSNWPVVNFRELKVIPLK